MDMDRYFFTFFSLTKSSYLRELNGDFMSHLSLRVSSHLLDTTLG